MRIADFPVPDTAAAHGALVLAREYHSPSTPEASSSRRTQWSVNGAFARMIRIGVGSVAISLS